MIEFVLDGRSRVSTYMQLVLQVKQALRVGLLVPGDQLPKVREVAESLAINPNTVLKAYRELEIEGLAEGRPGVGTFITRTLAGPSLASQVDLREDLRRLAAQGPGGRPDREDVTALIDTTIRAVLDGPRATGGRVNDMEQTRDDTALETAGLGKRYGRTWALQDCTLHLPTGRIAALVGPNGAGKTTLLHLAVGLLRPDAGACASSGRTPSTTPKALAEIGFVAQDTPLYRDFTAARTDHHGRQAQPDLGRRAGPHPAVGPGHRAEPAGRQALRRTARPGRARPRAGQAPAAAAARRADREPRPARTARVHAGPDGRGRRDRHHRAALLAPAGRPRARLRLPDRAADRARPARRPGRRPARRPPHPGRAAHRHDQIPGWPRWSGPATPTGSPPCSPAPTEPVTDPAWSVHDVTLEDLVLAYLAKADTRSTRTAWEVNA